MCICFKSLLYKFIDIDQNELTNVSIASLQFENVDDGMVYPATVENDAYNANCESMQASLKILGNSNQNRKI